MEGHFVCRGCGQILPNSMAVADRKPSKCRPCHARRKRSQHIFDPDAKAAAYRRTAIWAKGNAEHIRDYHRKRRYNLTRADYEAMLSRQGGVCAMCGLSPVSGIDLQVDHDHGCCPDIRKGSAGCGRCVRHLLHPLCNRLEGQVTDEILEGLVRYRGMYPRTVSK